MMKTIEDIQAKSKEGFEAYVNAASAWTRNFQNIANEAAEYSRASFEKSMAITDKVLSAKSFDKAVAVQQDYAKELLEDSVAQAKKFSELYINAAKEAYKPFEGQVAEFTKKATSVNK